MNTLEKQQRLTMELRTLAQTAGGLALAFSGGLDSRFLAFTAQHAGIPLLLLHARGPHIPPEDSAYVLHWARSRQLPLRVLDIDPLVLPLVAAGSPRRCYACKKALFSRFLEDVEGLPLCDGANASDYGEYRPGLQAAQELGILSPLARCGFSKADIRVQAVAMGMDNPHQQARSCLLTRFPYGMSPSIRLLQQLAAIESQIMRCFDRAGFQTDFRLRVLENGAFVLHLHELPPQKVQELLHAQLHRQGVPVRLEQLDQLSGYFDRQYHLQN